MRSFAAALLLFKKLVCARVLTALKCKAFQSQFIPIWVEEVNQEELITSGVLAGRQHPGFAHLGFFVFTGLSGGAFGFAPSCASI